MPARNAKCPLRPSRLLAGVPAADKPTGALVGEPPPLCTGMGTRKASAGQDRLPGRSLCLGCSAAALSSCRRLFNRSLVFKESVPLPGWKPLCKCLSFSILFHLYEWKKRDVSYISPSYRLQEICLSENVLCAGHPFAVMALSPCNRLVSY